MLRKNDEKIGVVIDVGNNGEGVIKNEEQVIFVPFAFIGETVKYKVLKVTSKVVFAKLIEVISPSKYRVEPICPVFSKCGGCQLQHVEYGAQLEIKKQSLITTFKKIALIDVAVNDCVCDDKQFRYRNKLQLPVCSDEKGQLKIGFYAENSHRVVEIEDCYINAEWTRPLIKAIKQYMCEFGLKGYLELNNTGDIREVTVREINNNLIITLVFTKERFVGIDRLVQILKENIPNTFSLYANVNDKQTNVIFGDKFYLLYGAKEYYGEMFGIKFPMGVQSFMQVNLGVCEKLYGTVKACVGNDEDTVVIDAYSGAGLMTALLANNAKKAIGVEIIKEAVDFANKLALSNGLVNKVLNYNGKCEEILPDIIVKERQLKEKICLVLDPPRKGCDIAVIRSILKSEIDKIIYVSCNPATLARDVGLLIGTLTEKDEKIIKADSVKPIYKIESITPFDMFPQTKHVETLVCLTRK